MVRVEVVQGASEVGGTCVRVADGDRVLVFDQGLRFSRFRRLYGFRVRPRGPDELRELGVLPGIEVLEGAEALYITHFHLDHLGLLGDLPDELVIRAPSRDALGLVEKWYSEAPDWTAFIPPRYSAVVEEAEPRVTDKRGVMALPVPHSAYPSTAYLYFGSDATVLYTGDLRLEALAQAGQLYRCTLFSFFEENPDVRVDKLVVEGTNFGRPVWPLSWEDALPLLRRLLALRGPLLIALHRLELDLFAALLGELRAAGRRVVVASKKLLDVVELWFGRLGLPAEGLLRAPALAEEPSSIELAGPEDLRDPSSFAVAADLYELVEFARDAAPEVELRGGLALLMLSEHEAEEGLEEAVALGWLRRLGLQPYRLRVSGHYYPHELARLIQLVKPREVVPVHTENPSLVHEIFRMLTSS
uniref:MBL fold metallo-hydrolase n=1 Tax=Thermofilum pendens TaxID=2269 RepID=A0A7J3X5W3_THEPE